MKFDVTFNTKGTLKFMSRGFFDHVAELSLSDKVQDYFEVGIYRFQTSDLKDKRRGEMISKFIEIWRYENAVVEEEEEKCFISMVV